MKESSKEDIMKKWTPILESMGVTNSHWGNLSQLAENQSNQILEENTLATENTSSDFSSILPIAMKVAAKTVSQNLVSVQPLDMMSKEERNKIEAEIKQENRDSKIEALVDGTEYKEKKVEEHPDYKKMPGGELFYLDYKYGHKKTRRSGKKHKKNG